MKKILVPIDFSYGTDQAVNFSIQIAKAVGSEITFTYVSPIPITGKVTYFMDSPLVSSTREKTMREFQEIERQHPELQEITYDFQFQMGSPAQIIATMGESLLFDLIILGTVGAKKEIEGTLGSLAHSIIKMTKCPVLAVPEAFHSADLSRIVLAIDFRTEIDYRMMHVLNLIARGLNSEIHIITITNKTKSKTAAKNRLLMAIWSKYLEGTKHHFHVVQNNDVERGILNYVKTNSIKMISVIPSRHDFLSSLFHKSISKRLVKHSKVPLLV